MTQSINIVITGVSRGLGRAMCSRFAAAQHTVIGCARSSEAIAALRQQYDTAHHFSVVDISNFDSVADWAAEVIGTYGPPDLLVNNAGMINSNANLWQISADEFRQVCQTNLGGTHATICAFLPSMIERGGGGVVNFSSTWGHSTSPQVAPYCATKWGVEGLTHALAEELPAGLFAVAVNPGVINTDMLKSCFGSLAEAYPTPDTWAESAVPFLLGLGPQHNGQSLRVP